MDKKVKGKYLNHLCIDVSCGLQSTYDIFYLKTSLFDNWLSKLKDKTARTAILMQIMTTGVVIRVRNNKILKNLINY